MLMQFDSFVCWLEVGNANRTNLLSERRSDKSSLHTYSSTMFPSGPGPLCFKADPLMPRTKTMMTGVLRSGKTSPTLDMEGTTGTTALFFKFGYIIDI